MVRRETPDSDQSRAVRLYAEYRRRVDLGERIRFEEFCAEHAEVETELRDLARSDTVDRPPDWVTRADSPEAEQAGGVTAATGTGYQRHLLRNLRIAIPVKKR